MKTTLLASFLILLLGESYPDDDLATAIDKSDVVGFFYRDMRAQSDDAVFKATEVFKGDASYLMVRTGDITANDETVYLVVGNRNKEFLSALNYPVTRVKDLPLSAMKILDSLPCYDESVKNANQHGTCTRQLEPVCGCDNKEYGNICEMRKHGIVKFKPGDCH